MPVVGRASRQGADRCAASRGGGASGGHGEAMGVGSSRAAGEFSNKLGRQALLWRRRTRTMDRALPALDRDLGPCTSIALHSGRIVVRSTGRDLGLQYRPPAWPAADAYRARYRAGHGILACRRRATMDRPQRADEAAGSADRRAAGLAYILGSDCRSDPGETCWGGRLIMLCRSSLIISRWVP